MVGVGSAGVGVVAFDGQIPENDVRAAPRGEDASVVAGHGQCRTVTFENQVGPDPSREAAAQAVLPLPGIKVDARAVRHVGNERIERFGHIFRARCVTIDGGTMTALTDRAGVGVTGDDSCGRPGRSVSRFLPDRYRNPHQRAVLRSWPSPCWPGAAVDVT